MEYIIIDPIGNCAEYFSIGKNGKFGFSDLLGTEDILKLLSLNKIEISLSEVFETDQVI